MSDSPATPIRHSSRIADMLIHRFLYDTPEWMERAVCGEPRTGVDHLYDGDEEAAKAQCGRCPVRDNCLRLGVETDADGGVWGGEVIADYLSPDDAEALADRVEA